MPNIKKIIAACFGLIVSIAIAFGLWARFAELGTWSLAIDEYYVAQSVKYFIEFGLPQYPCGGYYVRGLLYQLSAMPLLLAGFSAEFSLRVLSASFNVLAAIPLFLLARKYNGKTIAFVLIAIFALSAWEIEMARFGRMYAMFQALFLTYLYVLDRLVTEDEQKMWWPLLALTALAPFVWEGGVFVLALSAIPFFYHQSIRPLPMFASLLAIVSVIALFVSTKFRFMSDIPALAEASTLAGNNSMALFPNIYLFAPTASLSYFGVVLFAIVGIGATIWLLTREREMGLLAQASIIAAAVLSAANLLLAASIVIVGAVLIKAFNPTKNRTTLAALKIIVLMNASINITIAFATPALESTLTSNKLYLRENLLFPDILNGFLLPWLSALPVLTLVAAVSMGGLVLVIMLRPSNTQLTKSRILLLCLIICIGLGGLAKTNYAETRYTFYLYPLILLLSAHSLRLAADFLFAGRRPALVGPTAALLLVTIFVASADADFKHLRQLHSYEGNFRVDYDSARVSQYYARFDFASAAASIKAHAGENDVLISTQVVQGWYLPALTYIYLDSKDNRFRGQSCARGTLERWTNQRLISTKSELESIIRKANSNEQTVWLIRAEGNYAQTWERDLTFLNPDSTMTTKDRALSTLRFDPQ